MNKFTLLLSLMAGLLSYSISQAQECSPWIVNWGIHEFREVNVQGGCYLRAHSKVAKGTPFRDYLLATSGEIVVFNDYGQTTSAIKTGVRIFTVFPRQTKVAVAAKSKNIVIDTANPEMTFRMQSDQLGISGLSGIAVTEDPSINPYNNGGVELQVLTGLLLDSGFAQGMDPRLNSEGTSIFKDAAQNQCAVKNSDLFRSPSAKKVRFKFSDHDLRGYLAQKCPSLKLW